MRPSNPPRNVASFKNAESVATAPQLRAAACDGALSASHGGSQSGLYLKMFGLRRWRLPTGCRGPSDQLSSAPTFKDEERRATLIGQAQAWLRLAHLAQANRYIAELAVQLARQRVIVRHALDTGQGSEMAESLLDAVEGSLRIFEKHRIFLLRVQRISSACHWHHLFLQRAHGKATDAAARSGAEAPWTSRPKNQPICRSSRGPSSSS